MFRSKKNLRSELNFEREQNIALRKALLVQKKKAKESERIIDSLMRDYEDLLSKYKRRVEKYEIPKIFRKK